MSLALVTETAREVRRLAQAGSDLARGDFRLERLREPLAAAGARVPVFAKLAEAIGALTTAEAATDTADRLLTLATLTQAILATQAETGAPAGGELRPVETTPAPGGTTVPFRQLEPVLTALSTTGSGRLEIVKTAFELGHFNDLRLAVAAVRGLGDPLVDIAAFMADSVVPAYGPAILSLLRSGLDLQGGKAHARRLALVARFAGPAENPLYREAADTGSKEVKVAAITALGHDPDATPRLRELAKKGAKEVRAAALGALGQLGDEADIPLLVDALRGANGDEVALPAVRANKSPALTAALVAAGRADLPALLAGPKEKSAKATEAFVTLLRALGNRPDPEEVITFLGECLEQTPALAAAGMMPTGRFPNLLPRWVARALLTVGTPRALKVLTAFRGRFDRVLLGPVFRAAVRVQSPAEVFDGFAAYLDHDRPELRDVALEELGSLVCFQPEVRVPHGNLPHQANKAYEHSEYPLPDRNPIRWDPRWRARLMELDGWKDGVIAALTRVLRGSAVKRIFEVHQIVAALAAPGDAAVLRYLEAQLGNRPEAKGSQKSMTGWYGDALILLGLIQGAHPRAAELLFESAQRLLKLSYVGYQAMILRDVAGKLPPDQRAKFAGLAGELPDGDVRSQLLTPTTGA